MVSAGRARLIPITRALSHGTVCANARPIPPDAPEIHTRELAMDPNLLTTAQRRLPGNPSLGHLVINAIPCPIPLSRTAIFPPARSAYPPATAAIADRPLCAPSGSQRG